MLNHRLSVDSQPSTYSLEPHRNEMSSSAERKFNQCIRLRKEFKALHDLSVLTLPEKTEPK